MPHKDLAVRRAYLREYKRQHRHRYVKQIANYDRMRHANERAAKYGAPGVLTIEEAEAVMASGRCHYCGRSGLARMGIDHVIPLYAGGANRPENLVCSCEPCNISKYRSDRPYRWSRNHESCVDCDTTTFKHICHGRCARCHYKYDAAQRKRLRIVQELSRKQVAA